MGTLQSNYPPIFSISRPGWILCLYPYGSLEVLFYWLAALLENISGKYIPR